MGTSEILSILSFAFAIAGVVFALGKQSQNLAIAGNDINSLGKKLETHITRTDRRIDELANFTVRVDQRVANLERQVYGGAITEILRSGVDFPHSEDDIEAG
jgi:hypothetical protein